LGAGDSVVKGGPPVVGPICNSIDWIRPNLVKLSMRMMKLWF